LARQSYRDIGRMKPDGTFTDFLPNYEGRKFNSPNDMVFGPDGALWFTDQTFSVPGFVQTPGATQ
jgi:gluconolactonase